MFFEIIFVYNYYNFAFKFKNEKSTELILLTYLKYLVQCCFLNDNIFILYAQ